MCDFRDAMLMTNVCHFYPPYLIPCTYQNKYCENAEVLKKYTKIDGKFQATEVSGKLQAYYKT